MIGKCSRSDPNTVSSTRHTCVLSLCAVFLSATSSDWLAYSAQLWETLLSYFLYYLPQRERLSLKTVSHISVRDEKLHSVLLVYRPKASVDCLILRLLRARIENFLCRKENMRKEIRNIILCYINVFSVFVTSG